MRSIFLIPFLILCVTITFGQEKLSYKIVSDQFLKNFNESNYDTIFNMFSLNMQEALPIEKTKEFLGNSKKQLGIILRKDFTHYKKSFAVYKAFFENGILGLNISIDSAGKINGLSIGAFTSDDLPNLIRNTTLLNLPFQGTWFVTWGGDTKALNYHVESRAQKNAFDFLIIGTSGKSFKTDGNRNEDYYAFGKKILAPCNGEIVLAVDGIKDNIPGEMNSFHTGGNTIILKTVRNEYLVFCHLKNHSLMVNEGMVVKAGAFLGLCGNSGHSSEPHLHFHIQNTEDINIATGVKCYFAHLAVNGEIRNDISPVKGDLIENR